MSNPQPDKCVKSVAPTFPLAEWFAVLAASLIAYWPVWGWYWRRSVDGSDEAYGWLALVIAACFVLRDLHAAAASGTGGMATPASATPGWATLALPFACLMIYALGYAALPPLLRAMLALLTLAALLSRLVYRRVVLLRLAGLLLLSLPLVASLQFYAGYPLRALIARGVAPVLRLNGLSVISTGAYLQWDEQLILIDAPCSGIRMLWTGSLLCFTLACAWRLNNRQTALAAIFAVLAILYGNALRALALFYPEAQIIRLPAWSHTGIGLTSFALTACAIAAFTQALSTRRWPFAEVWCARYAWAISLFLLGCSLAAAAPYLHRETRLTRRTPSATMNNFPGWPQTWEGRMLQALPLTEREQQFARDFPGQLARFTDGEHELIIRWVTQPTRQLHPASDCFKGLGYTITPQPLTIDQAGRHWSSFLAQRADETLRIRERIFRADESASWTDVSTWYWQTLWQEAPHGAWAWTIAEHAMP